MRRIILAALATGSLAGSASATIMQLMVSGTISARSVNTFGSFDDADPNVGEALSWTLIYNSTTPAGNYSGTFPDSPDRVGAYQAYAFTGGVTINAGTSTILSDIASTTMEIRNNWFYTPIAGGYPAMDVVDGLSLIPTGPGAGINIGFSDVDLTDQALNSAALTNLRSLSGLNPSGFSYQVFEGGIFKTYSVTNLSMSLTNLDAVPEPASWTMFIGGFGLIGATMRRRKVNVSFVWPTPQVSG